MKLKVSFKHLEHTPALDQKIQEKSERFSKYFDGKVSVAWTCWTDDHGHWAEIKLHGPSFDFFAKATSDNLYKCLDIVCDKLERQVEKKKSKMRNRINYHNYESPKYIQIKMQEKYEEELYFKDYIEKTA
jgi:putative sigma-54 modulation protein